MRILRPNLPHSTVSAAARVAFADKTRAQEAVKVLRNHSLSGAKEKWLVVQNRVSHVQYLVLSDLSMRALYCESRSMCFSIPS